jgi:spoIIIJ-associated protein
MTESQPQTNDHGSSPNEFCHTVAHFCEDLVRWLRLELTVSVSEADGVVSVNFTGLDRPMLLSNTASLLNSMEYLLNKVFRTGRDSKISSIILDSESYRQHREAELVLLAQMASEKVLSQRKPLSLQPMTPKERRIVHLALAPIEGVRSQSEGDGDSRSITIYPS